MEYQRKIVDKNEQQDCYKVRWTQDKFREMELSLTGYWSKDVWSGANNPLKDQNRTSLILNFSNHMHVVKTELKFVLYSKMKNYEWSWGTVYLSNVLKNVIEFFGDKKLIVKNESIIEMSIDYWVSKLTDYFQEQGKLYS